MPGRCDRRGHDNLICDNLLKLLAAQRVPTDGAQAQVMRERLSDSAALSWCVIGVMKKVRERFALAEGQGKSINRRNSLGWTA